MAPSDEATDPVEVNEREALLRRDAEALLAQVTAIVRANPGADPDTVRHTLVLLRLDPLERLNRSLRRGRGFAAFRR